GVSAARYPFGLSGNSRDLFLTASDFCSFSRPSYLARRGNQDADEAAQLSLVLEPDDPWHFGVQGVISAAPHILSRLEPRTTLTNDDRAAGHELSVKSLHSQPLGVGIASIARAAETLFVRHFQSPVIQSVS